MPDPRFGQGRAAHFALEHLDCLDSGSQRGFCRPGSAVGQQFATGLGAVRLLVDLLGPIGRVFRIIFAVVRLAVGNVGRAVLAFPVISLRFALVGLTSGPDLRTVGLELEAGISAGFCGGEVAAIVGRRDVDIALERPDRAERAPAVLLGLAIVVML